MTASLAHRGPDAEGLYYQNGYALGHKRLSVIDLSQQANQPMHSGDERYVIVFNGEVYNFSEIAEELDLSLKTNSDTEVILESFAKWGPSFVERLNGMFAIAILDKKDQSLYLFRDRLGIKPLYYFWDNKTFAFGSEIKSLLQAEYINSTKSLNKEALNRYLHLGYIPEPLSIYNNIYKFPAGKWGVFRNSEIQFTRFWSPEEHVKSDPISDLTQAKAELVKVLESSVQYRLIGDVPYGSLLSGGIDSSLVTAIAQKCSTQKLKTFSIGIKGSQNNETPYAQKIATHLGTDHHELLITEKDILPQVEKLLDIYDEPYADSSAIPTLVVSEMARKEVTIALSGDGGDELFMGYGAHMWAKRLSNPIISKSGPLISKFLSSTIGKDKRTSDHFGNRDDNIRSGIFSREQYFFTNQEITALLTPEYQSADKFEPTFQKMDRPLAAEEEQALFDLKYYLKDDLLVKVDRASMHYSLENRVPLLDHRVVELSLNIDKSLKLKGGTHKYILKEVLSDYVPRELFERKKQGFSIPLGKWLQDDLKFLRETYLSEQIIQKYGVVNFEQVDMLLRKFDTGHDYLYTRIWTLIVLHKWLSERLGQNI